MKSLEERRVFVDIMGDVQVITWSDMAINLREDGYVTHVYRESGIDWRIMRSTTSTNMSEVEQMHKQVVAMIHQENAVQSGELQRW